jgi:translation initiation factor 4A
MMVLKLGEYMDATCHSCIGGTIIHDDMKHLEAGVQIVVGTPGRVNDMLNRSVLRM